MAFKYVCPSFQYKQKLGVFSNERVFQLLKRLHFPLLKKCHFGGTVSIRWVSSIWIPHANHIRHRDSNKSIEKEIMRYPSEYGVANWFHIDHFISWINFDWDIQFGSCSTGRSIWFIVQKWQTEIHRLKTCPWSFLNGEKICTIQSMEHCEWKISEDVTNSANVRNLMRHF